MDNNDSTKPQQTGGLKLMTVFIAVLALHVVVIGGFTVYHLMSGGSADADLVATDKSHKDLKVTDGSAPDAAQGDKSAPATTPTPPAEVAANPPTPAAEPAPATETAAATPAPAPAVTTPKPATSTPSTDVADKEAQAAPAPISPELAPPAEPTPSAPLALLPPIASGPVHMPANAPSSPKNGLAKSEQVKGETYVVKITDSYKKIAKAHHITVAQLKEANHIQGDTLHTGQKLVIPAGGKTLVAANKTDTTATTTALDSAPSGPILADPAPTPSVNLASAPPAITPSSSHHLYTVVKGDTLSKIAHKFKTTPSAIMAANRITDPTKLTIGKKLKIPSPESRSARNSAPAPAQPSQVQATPDAPSAQLANFVP